MISSHRLIQEAKQRLQTQGMRNLSKDIVNFAYRQTVRKGIENLVQHQLTDRMLSVTEFKSGHIATRTWMLDENIEGLSQETTSNIMPLNGRDHLRYNKYPTFVFRQPFVSELRNVTIVGPDAVPLTEQGTVIPETIHTPENPDQNRLLRAVTSALIDNPSLLLPVLFSKSTVPKSTDSLDTAALLHSRWNNYYHWTLEHQLKLRGIARYEAETERSVTLLIPPNPPTFITESLELLGFKNDRWREWNGGPINVDRLVVPSFPELTPKSLEWMRTRMFNAVPPVEDAPEWVYISRSNADKRRIINEAELQPIFEEYDVELVHCENLSMEEEIALFQATSGIIGAHGAGLTAAVWGTDLSMIEIFNDTIKSPYYILAHVLGHEYTAITGEPTGSATQRRNLDIDVNVPDVGRTLAAMMK